MPADGKPEEDDELYFDYETEDVEEAAPGRKDFYAGISDEDYSDEEEEDEDDEEENLDDYDEDNKIDL